MSDNRGNRTGYHTLELMFLPNGKRSRVLIWNNTKIDDTKERVE